MDDPRREHEYLPGSLFRREVARNEARDVYGQVSVGVSRWWTLLLVALLSALALAVIIFAAIPFTRYETVPGRVSLRAGAPLVQASSSGILSLLVREGEHVERGTPLFAVEEQPLLRGGTTDLQQTIALLAAEAQSLKEQRGSMLSSEREADAAQEAVIAGLRSDLESLDDQIGLQRRLVEGARDQLDGLDVLEQKGYITRRDVAQRRDAVSLRQQTLLGLVQDRRGKSAQLRGALAARRRAVPDARQRLLQLDRDGQRVVQRLRQARAQRSSTTVAPMDGVVAWIAGQSGQLTAVGSPVMMIAPEDAGVRAVLQVPSSAIGFIGPGDEVRLSVDAFPSQTFGSLAGVVTAVPDLPSGDGRDAVSTYRVTVAIPAPYVRAFGSRRSLKAGMALSARIIVGRENLFSWLFRPVFAVENR